jgi:hypothetical protein
MKDFRGKDIAVGATIVYPGRASSSLWMTEATVEKVNETGDCTQSLVARRTFDNRKVTLTEIGRVTVVQ